MTDRNWMKTPRGPLQRKASSLCFKLKDTWWTHVQLSQHQPPSGFATLGSSADLVVRVQVQRCSQCDLVPVDSREGIKNRQVNWPEIWSISKWNLFQVYKSLFNIQKLINIIHHINRLKKKNHMIILIDTGKNLTRYNTYVWQSEKEKSSTKLGIGGFPGGSVVKNLPASARDTRDMCLIPGSERSPKEGNGNPLQYSYLGNPMDRGAWRLTVHGIAESDRLSYWTCMHTS